MLHTPGFVTSCSRSRSAGAGGHGRGAGLARPGTPALPGRNPIFVPPRPGEGAGMRLGLAVPGGTGGRRARQGGERAHGGRKERANTARSAPPPLPAALPTPPPSLWDGHSAVSAARDGAIPPPWPAARPAASPPPSGGTRLHGPGRSGLRGAPHP